MKIITILPYVGLKLTTTAAAVHRTYRTYALPTALLKTSKYMYLTDDLQPFVSAFHFYAVRHIKDISCYVI